MLTLLLTLGLNVLSILFKLQLRGFERLDIRSPASRTRRSREEQCLQQPPAGVMTSDPRRVPAALPIPYLTFEEATELAFFGAAVLHPLAMQPALQNGRLDVRVKNSYNRRAAPPHNYEWNTAGHCCLLLPGSPRRQPCRGGVRFLEGWWSVLLALVPATAEFWRHELWLLARLQAGIGHFDPAGAGHV